MSVQEIYQQLLSEGKPPKDAAKEAQQRIGIALVTGKPIVKKLKFTPKGFKYGQFTTSSRGHGRFRQY